eukprot:6028449-Prymnesium_polylepis.1
MVRDSFREVTGRAMSKRSSATLSLAQAELQVHQPHSQSLWRRLRLSWLWATPPLAAPARPPPVPARPPP